MYLGRRTLLQMCCLVMVSMSMGLMGCTQAHTVLMMQLCHVLCMIGLVWWQSMSASMSVLVLLVRHWHVGTSWLCLVVLSVVHHTWMLGTLHASYTLAMYIKSVDTAG